MKEKEELEYIDYEDNEEDSINYDSLSTFYCGTCGKRLTLDEYEECEDTCNECLWDETSGLIDDDTEKSL